MHSVDARGASPLSSLLLSRILSSLFLLRDKTRDADAAGASRLCTPKLLYAREKQIKNSQRLIFNLSTSLCLSLRENQIKKIKRLHRPRERAPGRRKAPLRRRRCWSHRRRRRGRRRRRRGRRQQGQEAPLQQPGRARAGRAHLRLGQRDDVPPGEQLLLFECPYLI